MICFILKLFYIFVIIINQNKTKMKVINVRYFKTSRGVGYQCKTNVKGVEIWNDGNGGGTYLSGKYSELQSLKLHTKTEWELEKMIDKFEKVGN
jgi:hypothetical protein